MNQEIKQKWLNALRSDEYQQTAERLHDKNGFCCLGVLCDLYGKEHSIEWEEIDPGQYTHKIFRNMYYSFLYKTGTLPLQVREWAELFQDTLVVNRLAEMNDNGYTFEQIADVIETHL